MTYKVLRQLSGGGFSDVFEVEDQASALPERLILKRLNAEMSARPEVRAAFADEAKILRELRHPNIVTFRRCYFDEAKRVCLLMEKVVGEPLDAWSRRHASQPQYVLDVFEKVLQAVDYLHRRASPFFHLDLKPDNILVSPAAHEPQPVLIDFGIARRSGRRGLKAYTPPYGAPEQQTGETLGCFTDVHALGQILDEILDLLSLDGLGREALGAVAAKAKSPSRRARFADAAEMALAFRRARRASPAPASKSDPLMMLRGLPRWLYAAAGIAVGLPLLGGVLWLARPSPSAVETLSETSITDTASSRVAFDDLLAKAKTAVREGQFGSADQYYQEAKRLVESVPSGQEDGRTMERDLRTLRNQIDLVRQGGLEGERVLLDMR